MSKSEVYSWRVSSELKSALEEMARAERTTVARLLDRIVKAWLGRADAQGDHESVQRRMHEAAAKTLGTIHGGDPRRAERARHRVRTRLNKRRAG